MSWNDERVELLKKLWAEGLSASQIAGRLGGVTRNAVIGKVHRLGLSGRATSPRSASPRPRRNHVPRQNRSPSLLFGTRGTTALKAANDAETEMLPAPGDAWLPDHLGRRYTSEFRIVMVDLAELS